MLDASMNLDFLRLYLVLGGMILGDIKPIPCLLGFPRIIQGVKEDMG